MVVQMSAGYICKSARFQARMPYIWKVFQVAKALPSLSLCAVLIPLLEHLRGTLDHAVHSPICWGPAAQALTGGTTLQAEAVLSDAVVVLLGAKLLQGLTWVCRHCDCAAYSLCYIMMSCLRDRLQLLKACL